MGTYGAKTAGVKSQHVQVTNGSLKIEVSTNVNSPLPAASTSSDNGIAILNSFDVIPDVGDSHIPAVPRNMRLC